MTTQHAPELTTTSQSTTVLDVVIPVHNEEVALARSVERLLEHLTSMPWSYRVTIADNASTDRTSEIARRLSHEHPRVYTVHLAEKGRGRALRRVWSGSDAGVLVYMDVDLSTDLAALLPLVAPLISGHSDLAVGSRLASSSRIERGLKREVISRGYNLLLRSSLQVGFRDAQCGFKAITREAAAELLPLVEDQGWFFDTELLTVAERAGLRIHEVPVDWVDDPDSRVDILRTAYHDLRGVARLGTALALGRLPLREVGERLGRVPADAKRGSEATDRTTASGRIGSQAAMFVVVGVMSTLAYALVYLGLRPVAAPMTANVLALLLTAIANTAANRRFSFGVRGTRGALRHQVQGLVVLGFGIAFTGAALTLVPAGTHPTLEVVVLTFANLVVTVLRFTAMRWWMFARRAASST